MFARLAPVIRCKLVVEVVLDLQVWCMRALLGGVQNLWPTVIPMPKNPGNRSHLAYSAIHLIWYMDHNARVEASLKPSRLEGSAKVRPSARPGGPSQIQGGHLARSTDYLDPRGDPKTRSFLGFCNLHHRSIRVQNLLFGSSQDSG